MDDRSFARGARIRPKPKEALKASINEEISFPQFMAMVGIYAVRDYKVDRATFLRFAECGFEAATRTVSASEKS